MPPKRQVAKPKVVRVAPSKGKASKAQTLLNLVKNVGIATNDRCAFQILNADRSADQADFVDAPVNDGSPVHVFVTETSVTINSLNDASGVAGRIAFRIGPNPVQHIWYANAFDTTANGYAPLTGAVVACEGQASFASVYDDLRCCAIMVHVKDASLEEKMNGVIKVANVNPSSTPLTPANIEGLPGIEFPPQKTHYARVPWIPARPERDHAFVAPSAVTDMESTSVCGVGTFALTAVGPVSVRLRVFAIWAARLQPDTDYIASPKMYAIDPSEVEQRLQAMFLEAPLWSQARIMAKDDGAIGSIIQDGKTAFGGASKLFGSDSSLSDRVSGGIDLVRSIGSIGSTIAGWFSIQEKVAARLSSFSNEELLFAQHLLTPGANPLRSSCPSREMIQQLAQRYRAERLWKRSGASRGRPSYHTCDYVEYDDLPVQPAELRSEEYKRCHPENRLIGLAWLDFPPINDSDTLKRDQIDRHLIVSGRYRGYPIGRCDRPVAVEEPEAPAAPEEAVAEYRELQPMSTRSRVENAPTPAPNAARTTSLSSLLREGRI